MAWVHLLSEASAGVTSETVPKNEKAIANVRNLFNVILPFSQRDTRRGGTLPLSEVFLKSDNLWGGGC